MWFLTSQILWELLAEEIFFVRHNIIKLLKQYKIGDIQSGTGLHQESSLQRSGDTRWSSRYVSLISLITMFSSVIDVLDVIVEDVTNSEQKGQACVLLQEMRDSRWDFLLIEVSSFCEKNNINISKMDDKFVDKGRS